MAANVGGGAWTVHELAPRLRVRNEGFRTVYFELNGQGRQVSVRNRSLASAVEQRCKADRDSPGHLAPSMLGTVVFLHAKHGDRMELGASIQAIEAMKMETVVRAPRAGAIKELLAALKRSVQAGDLLAALE